MDIQYLYWSDKGYKLIADCIKYSYTHCPYNDGLFKKLYMYNATYNIPCLIMFAFYIHSLPSKKRIFCSENSCYLYIIYSRLFPLDLTELLLISEHLVTNSSDTYIKRVIVSDSLIIDLNNNNTINKYCSKTDNIDSVFLSDFINTNTLQFLNYVRFGSCVKFDSNFPIFSETPYPIYLTYPIEQNILNIVKFLNEYDKNIKCPVDFKILDTFNKPIYDDYILKQIKNKYKNCDKNNIDDNGLVKYQEFFNIFNQNTRKNISEDPPDVPIYIINMPKHTDRKIHMIKLLESLSLTNYKFVEPYPATINTRNELAIFLGCDTTNMDKSLSRNSHTLTYFNLLAENTDESMIILEDDIDTLNSAQDTSILLNYIVTNYPKDTDMIYLEYCFERCKGHTNDIFVKLKNPLCLAAVFYPSKKHRENIITEIRKFHRKFLYEATDNTIRDIIWRNKIVAYEQQLLFYQDKKFGSYIIGSSPDHCPYCTEIEYDNSKYFLPIENSNKKSSNLYINIFMLFSVVIGLTCMCMIIRKNYKMCIITLTIFLLIFCIYNFRSKKVINTKAYRIHNSVVTENLPKYKLYTGMTEYRLGDMINNKTERYKENGEKYHYTHFSDSIASEYMRNTSDQSDMKVLYKIVKDKKGEKPLKNYYVIHLRIGDTIENKGFSVLDVLSKQVYIDGTLEYAKSLSYFEGKIDKIKEYDIKNIILVAGSHGNIDFTKSSLYINCIKKFFEEYWLKVYLRLGKNPDEDLVYMSSADYFSESGGGFSKTIKELVIMNGGKIL